MRLIVVLLIASTAVARADAKIRPEDTAGMYWIPYETCDDCAAPAALAAYVTPDEGRARTIRAQLDGKLAFGLPYVIHTDQLDNGGSRVVVPRRGIAVVLGSFGTVDAARDAAKKAPAIAGVHAIVLDLKEWTDSFGDAAHLVTVVDRGAPVPAWSARDIKRMMGVIDNGEYEGSREQAMARALAKLKPLCTVKPGDLFEARAKDQRWYELAPVRCGREPAYIPWTASLLGHAVIVKQGSGYRLYQVTGAMCDSPNIDEWRYDEHGRHGDGDTPLLASAGC
jgi:hypothetical protein